MDFDRLRFSCTQNRDCPPDQVCNLETQLCGPLDVSPAGDGGLLDEDGGPRADAGVEESMRCSQAGRSWWCLSATSAELETFAAMNDASIVDLERMQSGRWAAVLWANDGLERSWSFALERGNGFPSLPPGMRPTNFEPYAGDDGSTSFAATFTSSAYGCAWFATTSAADEPSVRAKLALARVSQPLVTLDRFVSGGRDTAIFATFGSGTSTIAFDMGAAVIDGLLEDGTRTLLSFQTAAERNRYNVAFGETQADAPRQSWLHGLSEEDLALQATASFVANLDLNDDGELSAILVASSTRTDTRAADGARLQAMLAMSLADASAGVYSKELRGAPLLYANERATFAAANMLAPVIAVYALELTERDPPDLSLEDAIDIPAAGCNTSTVVATTATIGAAIAGMLRDQDAARATALLDRLGTADVTEYVSHLSMPRSALVVPPGCDRPDRASRTTLIDQAMAYELALHCLLRATHNSALRAWLPGRTSDAEGMRARLDALIDEEAAAAGIATIPSALRNGAEVIYTASTLSEPQSSIVRRALAGRVRVPYCTANNTIDYWAYFFGFFLEGHGDAAAAESAIARVKTELMRDPVRRGLSTGVACY